MYSITDYTVQSVRVDYLTLMVERTNCRRVDMRGGYNEKPTQIRPSQRKTNTDEKFSI